MFEDSLFASAKSDQPKRWTALFSFTIQSMVVATFLMLPMLFTEALPFHPMRAMVQLRSLPSARQVGEVARTLASRDLSREVFRVPRNIPLVTSRTIDNAAAPPIDFGPPALSGASVDGPMMSSLLTPARGYSRDPANPPQVRAGLRRS